MHERDCSDHGELRRALGSGGMTGTVSPQLSLESERYFGAFMIAPSLLFSEPQSAQ